jgi:hypothetical protein
MARKRNKKGQFVKKKTPARRKTSAPKRRRRSTGRRALTRVRRTKRKKTGFARAKQDLTYPLVSSAALALIPTFDIGPLKKLMQMEPFKTLTWPGTVALALYAAAEVIPMNKSTREKLYNLAIAPASLAFWLYATQLLQPPGIAFAKHWDGEAASTSGLGEIRDLPSDLSAWWE